MYYIAHRGNLYGPNPSMENNPEYVKNALDSGFDAEIDVWYINGKFQLGHDEPQYDVDASFLIHDRVWCHAKNIDALEMLLSIGAHCFWHEKDMYTLTSKGIIWAYPGSPLTKNTICVMCSPNTENVLGVCSDDVVFQKMHQVIGDT
jgi:hypothetical protein